MIEIKLESDFSSLQKEMQLKISGILSLYGDKLFQALKPLEAEIRQIGIDETEKHTFTAKGRLIDSYYARVQKISDGIMLEFGNTAKADGHNVYYWNVIDTGRKKGEKAPPVGDILEYGIKSGRFSLRTAKLNNEPKNLNDHLLRQAFALSIHISNEGIKARPQIFEDMRKKIYTLAIDRITKVSKEVFNG